MATKAEALRSIVELRAALANAGQPHSGPAVALRHLLDVQRDYLADGSPTWRIAIIEEAAEKLAESFARHVERTKEVLADEEA